MAAQANPLDILVVGAGVYGICFANTYLSLHPTANILVLDSGDDVGGVWETKRNYPNFISQHGIRMTGFPDVPFEPPEEAERQNDLCEAKYLSKYLEEYVTCRQHDGKSLRDRFIFQCWVTKIRKVDELWHAEANLRGADVTYPAKKLVIATGLSSIPNMPDLPHREAFQGPIIHQKDFGRSGILTAEEDQRKQHRHITVLGGSKSAADIAYAAAKDPNTARKVSWIIRSSGTGPPVFAEAKSPFSKYRNLTEIASTRAMGCLSTANPWLPANTWREWLLYRTSLGDWLLDAIGRRTETEVRAVADFRGREGRLPGFEGLQATSNQRWRAGPVGLMQRDDFWDVVARNVQIHRGDVADMTEDAVVLEDGTKVRTDVLLCGTGWKQGNSCFDADEAVRLGLPVKLSQAQCTGEIEEHWRRLEQEADQDVLKRWPGLKESVKYQKSIDTTPYRLYNMSIPISDQSIAVLGLPLVPNSYTTSLVQSLFAIACFDGAISLPPQAEAERSVAFTNAWCRRKYPVYGPYGNWIEFEMVAWTDRLLEELGLQSHRLSERVRRSWSGWWRDLTNVAFMSDYAGLVDEYRRKYVKTLHD